MTAARVDCMLLWAKIDRTPGGRPVPRRRGLGWGRCLRDNFLGFESGMVWRFLWRLGGRGRLATWIFRSIPSSEAAIQDSLGRQPGDSPRGKWPRSDPHRTGGLLILA